MKAEVSTCRKTITCWLGVLAAAPSLLTGCASTEPSSQPSPEPTRIQAVGTAFLERAGQLTDPTPLHNATFVEAVGNGFPADSAETSAQKKLTALKAARYGALAKLAEELQGLELTRNARVQDMVFSGEEVTATLSGSILGASTVAEDYDAQSELASVRLRIAVDPDGHIIPQRATRISPTSLPQRKAAAEAAARINALAALGEQMGEVYVMQDIQVKDLQFDRQEAQLSMDGLLVGVQVSAPRWISNTQCEVTAWCEITPETATELEHSSKEVRRTETSLDP